MILTRHSAEHSNGAQRGPMLEPWDISRAWADREVRGLREREPTGGKPPRRARGPSHRSVPSEVCLRRRRDRNRGRGLPESSPPSTVPSERVPPCPETQAPRAPALAHTPSRRGDG